MRDRMKDEHYFIILSQKERKNIIMFEDAVKKTTLEKGELDRGTRNGYSILINSYEKEINLLYSLGENLETIEECYKKLLFYYSKMWDTGAGRHCVRHVVRSGDIANKNAGRSLHPVTVNYLLVAGRTVHRDLTRSLLCCTDHSHRLLAPVFSPLAHEFTHTFRRRSPFAGTERDTSALWIDCLRHTHHRQHGSNSGHNWLGRPGRSAHCPLVDRS